MGGAHRYCGLFGFQRTDRESSASDFFGNTRTTDSPIVAACAQIAKQSQIQIQAARWRASGADLAQQCLCLRPEPQGQGALRGVPAGWFSVLQNEPTAAAVGAFTGCGGSLSSPAPFPSPGPATPARASAL